jgi:tRNA A-37 threonylcarbamoyl transferase component Bud32
MPADPKKIKTIFLDAVEKATCEERETFLIDACAGDEELRRRVDELLRAHDEPGGVPGVPDRGTPQQSANANDLSFLTPPSEPGSLGRLDHYEILEVVGRGGTGVVLRARDTKLLRVVAIKVLAAALAASGTARQRFVREARAAAALRDDHVIAIHAVEDQGPVPYLVMEFIDGCTLESLRRHGGSLEVKQILRIGIQTASGLAAAHKQGLIHRDIKPANILLENGVQRVKLTDFGLARAADDASITQSGFIAGTPLYMSPEQAAGEPIDTRADLFSLGSVLYELCTGRQSFRAATTVAVIKRVCEETPRSIRDVNPDIPESLCRVIERLQAKKPADRPASAKEVADLLAGLLADLNGGGPRAPERADVPQGFTQQARHGRRKWHWAAAALILLAAGLGLSEATGVTDVRGTVIRLFSPEGTLVVEVDDSDVNVTVDGADVVISGAGAKEIRLKPGQYKVQATRDGKVVRQELVTVERNGRRLVRISKESPALSEAERWEKAVAALPAEQQVKAVVRRLKELNPAFDGTVKHEIDNGVVRKLSFLSDDVADISPVRALKELLALNCKGSAAGKGKVADLEPLRGLLLTSLDANNTQVEDLGPLRGMPLRHLFLSFCRVADLSPVGGMQLEMLTLVGTRVKDLAPLKGMPLKWLDVAEARGVSDLAALQGMPLEYLNVSGTALSDLSRLAGLKSLWNLLLDSTPVSDLTPLRGSNLKVLSILNIPAKDLSPLKELPLKRLRLDYRADRAEFVRSFTGLEAINDKSVAEFWKEVDGK